MEISTKRRQKSQGEELSINDVKEAKGIISRKEGDVNNRIKIEKYSRHLVSLENSEGQEKSNCTG